MAKRKIQAKPTSGTSKPGKSKKQKQPTQKSPQGRRVMVVGPSGKRRFEWMP